MCPAFSATGIPVGPLHRLQVPAANQQRAHRDQVPRNSMDHILRYVGSWISSRLAYRQPLGCEEEDNLYLLYVTLGATPSDAEAAARTLHLRFEGCNLFISTDMMAAGDVVGLVHHTLLALWKWIDFKRFEMAVIRAFSQMLAFEQPHRGR